jgi:serine protease inhibitor ecotin
MTNTRVERNNAERILQVPLYKALVCTKHMGQPLLGSYLVNKVVSPASVMPGCPTERNNVRFG